jgi:predicted histidine transporter YuiF (NhaC family)
MVPAGSVEAATKAATVFGLQVGSVSSWLTFAGIVAGLVMSYFKFIPKNRETISARANALEEERRGDMEAMRGEMRETRKLAADAMMAAQAAESRSSILRAVVSMLTAEIQRTDPANPVLRQAQVMIADASMGDLGLGKGMVELAKRVVDLP